MGRRRRRRKRRRRDDSLSKSARRRMGSEKIEPEVRAAATSSRCGEKSDGLLALSFFPGHVEDARGEDTAVCKRYAPDLKLRVLLDLCY